MQELTTKTIQFTKKTLKKITRQNTSNPEICQVSIPSFSINHEGDENRGHFSWVREVITRVRKKTNTIITRVPGRCHGSMTCFFFRGLGDFLIMALHLTTQKKTHTFWVKGMLEEKPPAGNNRKRHPYGWVRSFESFHHHLPTPSERFHPSNHLAHSHGLFFGGEKKTKKSEKTKTPSIYSFHLYRKLPDFFSVRIP